jgi:hypothetical protein
VHNTLEQFVGGFDSNGVRCAVRKHLLEFIDSGVVPEERPMGMTVKKIQEVIDRRHLDETHSGVLIFRDYCRMTFLAALQARRSTWHSSLYPIVAARCEDAYEELLVQLVRGVDTKSALERLAAFNIDTDTSWLKIRDRAIDLCLIDGNMFSQI